MTNNNTIHIIEFSVDQRNAIIQPSIPGNGWFFGDAADSFSDLTVF